VLVWLLLFCIITLLITLKLFKFPETFFLYVPGFDDVPFSGSLKPVWLPCFYRLQQCTLRPINALHFIDNPVLPQECGYCASRKPLTRYNAV
ncbi:MAG: hypothetical protein O7D30_04420, partial [Rickettsia endosymbiont of Ixodes persulcatus]|nr:hypothetical protein [Rickettsia endosymbiont of Ixodes persulcatus]